MPVPLVTDEFIQFNLGTPEDPALVRFIFDALYEMPRVTIDDVAQSLIKIKMVILGYVYTGWGRDADSTKQNWRSWLAESGLYSDAVDKDANQECERAIQNMVTDLSLKWAQRGWWTNARDEDGDFTFCSLCYREKGLSNESEDNPKFVGFVVEQAEDGLRNHGFSDYSAPVELLLCAEHLLEVASRSIEVSSIDEVRRAVRVLEELLENAERNGG